MSYITVKGSEVQVGDQVWERASNLKVYEVCIPSYWFDKGDKYEFRRPIVGEWINVKDRLPTEEDTYDRCILAQWTRYGKVFEWGKWGITPFLGYCASRQPYEDAWWMPVPKLTIPEPPIIVSESDGDEHKVFFYPDGSLDIGNYVHINSNKMDEIIKRREKIHENKN